MENKASSYQENQSLLLQNPEMASALKEIATYKEYPKNHLLCETGMICNHFYIITSGITRMYYYKDGKDITVHFCTEDETASVFESFVKREKSKFNIETLEPIKAYVVSHKDFEYLTSKNDYKFERFTRLFVQQLHINLIERINDLHFHNAKERYDKLLNRKPELFQRASLKQIASYLNITPETLSRIRGK